MIYVFKYKNIFIYKDIPLTQITVRRVRTGDYYGLNYTTPYYTQKSNSILMGRVTGLTTAQIEALDVIDYWAIFKIINDSVKP